MMDPRVFFAAERTLLAWVRTGLTIIALGFVVARFGLFLSLLSVTAPTHAQHAWSGLLGVALVIAGSLAICGALYNHRRYVRTLPAADIPPIAMPWLTTALSLTIALCGLLLAAYLAIA
jgi:putative membrane protein